MISLAAQMEVARRALQAHQMAMSVAGINIANVNTPGFSRRSPVVRPGNEIHTEIGAVGTGVDVVNITRHREASLDIVFRNHNSDMGRWSGVETYLGQVEAVLGEPDGGGLSEVLSEFWNAWSDLSNDPGTSGVRAQVRGIGQQVCDVFHRLHAQLQGLQQSLTEDVTEQVERVNQLAEAVGGLNARIQESELGGLEASGLRDERDSLLDELSGLVDISVTTDDQGMATVMIDSQVLVQQGSVRRIAMESSVENGRPATRLFWEGSGHDVEVGSGQLRGCLDVRDDYIGGYLTDLDALAVNLVSHLNTLHAAGTGLDGSSGNNFFHPDRITAQNITVDPAIVSDLNRIAASAGGEVGDGLNALAIANLGSTAVMLDDTATIDDFYSALVGRIGLDSQEAASFTATEGSLMLDIENRRMMTSGVSLDEEMSYMLSYQHAYEAMIRVASALDEMTVTLINAYGS